MSVAEWVDTYGISSSSNPQIASSNLQVTSSNTRVTSSNHEFKDH